MHLVWKWTFFFFPLTSSAFHHCHFWSEKDILLNSLLHDARFSISPLFPHSRSFLPPSVFSTPRIVNFNNKFVIPLPPTPFKMPSFKTTAIAAIALFVSTKAQYVIDPESVPIETRNKWCVSQEAVCPLLCLQLPGASATTASNTCDAPTLTYSCVCGNGLSPNISEYSETLPFFICVQWQENCVRGCGNGNTACQSSCRQDHPCGAQNPTRVNVTTTSSAMAATGTGGADGSPTPSVYNGFGGAAATTAAAAAGGASSSSPSSGAQTALDLGRSYGIMFVITGLFAGFALVI